MAPGTFKKLGNFFRNIWDGTKKVIGKLAPITKSILPFLSPIIPGGSFTTGLIEKGIDLGENIINATNSTNTSKSSSGFTPIYNMSKSFMDLQKPVKYNVDSPRIRLKGIPQSYEMSR